MYVHVCMHVNDLGDEVEVGVGHPRGSPYHLKEKK